MFITLFTFPRNHKTILNFPDHLQQIVYIHVMTTLAKPMESEIIMTITLISGHLHTILEFVLL